MKTFLLWLANMETKKSVSTFSFTCHIQFLPNAFMIEKVQDLFTQIKEPFVATCITTNGIVKTNGRAVMGAGVAKLVRDKYPNCDLVLGTLISQNGNIVQQFLSKPVILVAFPSKNNYINTSSLQLIEQSARQLKVWADQHNQYGTIILPRPGCSNGGLDWSQVKSVIAPILKEDKFIVITNEE